MSHPDGHHQPGSRSAERPGPSRGLAGIVQRLIGVLLGSLAWMLPLLLALEPAAALAHLAGAPESAPLGPALIASLPADPRQPSLPAAAPEAAAVMGPTAASPVPTAPSPDPAASLPQLFQRALEASRAGRFELALPLWNRVLDQAPNDAAAWSNRGNVQLALGDPLAAIADQGQSLLLEPENADAHLNRGTAEEALGRWDAAAADYAWILERNPLDASALYNLGNVQGSRGDWQAARDSFVTAADARPGFAMARSSAALAAFQLGDLTAAERELRFLIRRYPLFADARAGLTALLWQRGASGEAESHWAAASGLDPRYRQSEWLLKIRRWPPGPVAALERFQRLRS